MYKDKQKQYEWDASYKKENTRLIGLRMHNVHDADILSIVRNADSIQGELKRLIRLGILYEKNGGNTDTEPLPEAYLKAINSEPDPETEELIRFGKEYKKLLDAGCVMVDRKMLYRNPEPEKKSKPMIDLRKVVRGTVDNPGSVPDPE